MDQGALRAVILAVFIDRASTEWVMSVHTKSVKCFLFHLMYQCYHCLGWRIPHNNSDFEDMTVKIVGCLGSQSFRNLEFSNHLQSPTAFSRTITRSPSASDVREPLVSTSKVTHAKDIMLSRPWVCHRCNYRGAAVDGECGFCAHQRCGKCLRLFEEEILYGQQDMATTHRSLTKE